MLFRSVDGAPLGVPAEKLPPAEASGLELPPPPPPPDMPSYCFASASTPSELHCGHGGGFRRLVTDNSAGERPQLAGLGVGRSADWGDFGRAGRKP